MLPSLITGRRVFYAQYFQCFVNYPVPYIQILLKLNDRQSVVT